MKIEEKIDKYLFESVDWKAFYKGAKDTSGFDADFEKAYGHIVLLPHIEDALKKTKNFEQFMRAIRPFEKSTIKTYGAFNRKGERIRVTIPED